MTFLFTRAFSKCQYLRGVFTGRCGADELDLKMKPELMCVDESTNSSQLITSPSPPYRSSSSLPPPPPFHSQSLTVGILLLSKPRDICLPPRLPPLKPRDRCGRSLKSQWLKQRGWFLFIFYTE